MATSFSASVTDIRLASRVDGCSLWHIQLDHSEFSESAATGTLTAVAASGAVLVVHVGGVAFDSHGELWHVTEKPLPIDVVVEGNVA